MTKRRGSIHDSGAGETTDECSAHGVCVGDEVPATVAVLCSSGSRSSDSGDAGARLLRRRLDGAVGSADTQRSADEATVGDRLHLVA